MCCSQILLHNLWTIALWSEAASLLWLCACWRTALFNASCPEQWHSQASWAVRPAIWQPSEQQKRLIFLGELFCCNCYLRLLGSNKRIRFSMLISRFQHSFFVIKKNHTNHFDHIWEKKLCFSLGKGCWRETFSLCLDFCFLCLSPALPTCLASPSMSNARMLHCSDRSRVWAHAVLNTVSMDLEKSTFCLHFSITFRL